MPFVGVPDRGLNAERAQHPDAGNAEHPLLPQARFRSTGVEARGQTAIRLVVAIQIGVEEVHRDASHHDAPHAHLDLAAGDGDGDEGGAAIAIIASERGMNGVSVALDGSYW